MLHISGQQTPFSSALVRGSFLITIKKGVHGMYEKLLIALLAFANEQLREYLAQDEISEGELRLLNKLLEVEE